ncbi:putative sulfoacetate--CoA ligase [Zhongshania aliphaticivorans]|uniref:Putative sulfoacetate--CoA ligase n=1 Tax=Zhongshania aliphaticivorans TaxID=1470434 RepID=A0A5S9PSN1_9GAMM|nr:AMP-binding protein [Zhongshania aliphaticivorans]CAA0107186.1 putative sulfoacetate--CoA ligase [Zhongshania aliphaticivorans]CAA0107274.1 putative sulfoacetate--CoA ligase [Zhongshania aliphaticivorans]
MQGALNAILQDAFDKYPTNPAITSDNKPTINFAELREILTGIQQSLTSSGYQPGDRIAVILPQGPENALTCLGIMQHYCCVPLNPELTSSELNSILSSLSLSAVVTQNELLPHVIGIAKQLNIPQINIVESTQGLSDIQLKCQPRNKPEPYCGDNTKQATLLLHTSGSSSQPKAVPLCETQLVASVDYLCKSLKLTQDDRCYNNLPLFHIGGLLDMLLAPLSQGGNVYLGNNMSSAGFINSLNTFLPTWWQAVPTMIHDVCSQLNSPPEHHLRFCRSVSSPLPSVLREKLENLFSIPVIEIYGMTETAGVIASQAFTSQKNGSVGQSAGSDIMITDDHGNAAKSMQTGEVLVRGKNVFKGYENSANQTDEFIGEWFRTGDLGYSDKDGDLFLCGRIKDIINRGGEKISSRQIDEALLTLPGIEDAACFGIPHPTLGEDIAAALVMKKGPSPDHQLLRTLLREQLPPFKVPRHFYISTQLPRTSGGKLQRQRLKEIHSTPAAPLNQQPLQATTPLAKLLANLWQEALEIPHININDNFFDLGGDSLKAATFMSFLSEKLEHEIPPLALFDHPTIESLEAYLSTQDIDSTAITHPLVVNGFPKPMYQSFMGFMSGWRGERRNSDSLLVGHNTLGSKPALFWGSQSFEEFSLPAKHLGSEQPVYGFRSLYQVPNKTDAHLKQLADVLTKEIQLIQKTGPYLLGGFCAGATLAFEIAKRLIAKGEIISQLILMEKFIAEPYSGRVSYFFSNHSRNSPYLKFHTPEVAWPRYYQGEVSCHCFDIPHTKFLLSGNIEKVSKVMKSEIQLAHKNKTSPKRILENKSLQTRDITNDDCCAEISAVIPRRLSPGNQFSTTIDIHNTGKSHWESSSISGIYLYAKWRSRHSEKVRYWKAGRAALHKTLLSGDKVSININISIPKEIRRWQLEFDLAQEGLFYFKNKGATPAIFPITVFPTPAEILIQWAEKIKLLNKTKDKK